MVKKGVFPFFLLSWNESEGYREAGYFPEAVVNFLALLGWNPGTEQELFSLDELVKTFSLERVNKSGARFDPEKTKWYNHQWLQKKSDKELASLFSSVLEEKEIPCDARNDSYVEKVVGLIKERADFVSDFWELGSYFFEAPTNYAEKPVKKQWKEDTGDLLKKVTDIISETDDFTSAQIETNIKAWITENELSFGKVMGPLRLVIVGDLKGPHLFDILEMLGKAECLRRIEKGLKTLG